MQLHTGQILELLDARRRVLGRVTLEGRENDLLSGRFAPGAAFPEVEQLFRDFEEAADSQALGIIERLDASIAALGLLLVAPGDSAETAVRDVQIWRDGGITCRFANATAADERGACHPLTLDPLLAGVTDDNRRPETSTGPPVGKEVW